MVGRGQQEALMHESIETSRPRGARLRRALMIATPIVMLMGVIRFGLWWGAESQRALLHGRRWPPESLLVFLGR
jgi:hypothetical protein